MLVVATLDKREFALSSTAVDPVKTHPLMLDATQPRNLYFITYE